MRMPRTVMKFGGTSVGDAERIRTAAALVAERQERRPLVVVSAASGVTNVLCEMLEAARDRREWGVLLQALSDRHAGLLTELRLDVESLQESVGELRDVLHGIELLREVTPRTWDLVTGYGEQLLAPIFAAHLETVTGRPCRAWHAGDLGLLTDDRFTRARPLDHAYGRIRETLEAAPEHLPVVTGFVGRTECGEATTLGRGGSDYWASILARAVEAEELQIWTDVDGILTADPRVVEGARVIASLGFQEASELAFSGAKVLHPQTITPAMEKNIPVRVLNTLRPEAPGTLITGAVDPAAPIVRSIAHKSAVRVITVISPRMVARHGFIERIAQVFDRYGVSIDMISTSEISVSFSTEDPVDRYDGFLADLREFSSVEVEEGRGMVSVVGSRLAADRDLFGEVFRALSQARVDVEMISYGATRINLSFLVPEEQLEAAVQALHRRYFES